MGLPNVIAVVLPLLLRFSFIPGGGAAPCSTDTMAMNVTTTADLRNMIQMINCTGEGTFKVSWMGSVQLEQVIELSDKKELSVTGSTSDLPIQPISVIDAGSTTGIFRVYNGSTLRLTQLMLERGNSDNGAAVDARSFSSVYVVDCTFANNNATTGGAIHAYNSELHIEGDTEFADNSAQSHGGAIYFENSKVQINGNISFANNSAGDEGGAIYASTSQAHIVGESYFGYNTAGSSGGAISADGSEIYIDGHTSFLGNSAILNGGVINAISSNVTISGWTTCTRNSAENDAGVAYARSSRIRFSGESYFVSSSVSSAGGVFFGVSSEFHVEGDSSFANNSAIGRGGAITTYRGQVYTTGSTSFVHNSAGEEGGNTSDSSDHLPCLGGFKRLRPNLDRLSRICCRYQCDQHCRQQESQHCRQHCGQHFRRHCRQHCRPYRCQHRWRHSTVEVEPKRVLTLNMNRSLDPCPNHQR